MSIRPQCPKDIFIRKGRCLVMRGAHPGQTGLTAIETGLTGMAATLAIEFSELGKAEVSSWRKLVAGYCIIQDALKDKVKTSKRCSRVIWQSSIPRGIAKTN
jgi:hypothetical protein